MKRIMKRIIQIQKVDLDTAGAAFLLEVTREDKVEAVRGDASPADITDVNTVCIECGGSGDWHLNCWDHHKAGGPEDSAVMQVWKHLNNLRDRSEEYPLVNYINQLDTQGPQALPAYGQVEFPTLSDCFAGMLLTERNPVEQLHKGVEFLAKVIETGQDPFGTIEGFDSYAEAKAEHNQLSAEAVEKAEWAVSSTGLKVGYLESRFFGALGALYGKGAQVVVALNPSLNGVRKFTIGGNGVRVDPILPELNALEAGWGGPPTGTILGSSREGSNLSLEEIVRVVKKGL